MVVGRTKAGKTSLLRSLGLFDSQVKKTESIEYSPTYIDSPGEFIDMPRFYHAVITSSAKAGVVLFVVDSSSPDGLPSGIAKTFAAPVLGCINKIDLLKEEDYEEKINYAKSMLLEAGAKEVYAVSAKEGKGVRELSERIKEILRRCEMK